MSATRIIDATGAVEDAHMLLSIAIGAVDEEADVIEVNAELTCTPIYMLKTAINVLGSIIQDDIALSSDAQLLISSIKAQAAIAQMQGA